MEPTHEIELTEPVNLCLDDGKTLNPRARGWSRTPLHRANMRGVWGRTKRWDYWAVLSHDLVFGLVYADVDYIGLAGIWWCDLRTGTSGGRQIVSPLAKGISLPEIPGSRPLSYTGSKLKLRLIDSEAGGDQVVDITGQWTESDDTAASLDLRVRRPAGHESLSVVIPWSDSRYNFTTKDQALPTTGTFTLGAVTHQIGGPAGEAWGVLDVGRGRWPYDTNWNWGGGAGYATTGELIGIQFGAKWTEGTGFTENAITVDGRLHKIGRELVWTYSWEDPMEPWRVRDRDGAVDLVLTPRYDKQENTDALVLRTLVHQMFGTWSGTVAGEDGKIYTVENVPGFAEECRNRW